MPHLVRIIPNFTQDIDEVRSSVRLLDSLSMRGGRGLMPQMPGCSWIAVFPLPPVHRSLARVVATNDLVKGSWFLLLLQVSLRAGLLAQLLPDLVGKMERMKADTLADLIKDPAVRTPPTDIQARLLAIHPRGAMRPVSCLPGTQGLDCEALLSTLVTDILRIAL